MKLCAAGVEAEDFAKVDREMMPVEGIGDLDIVNSVINAKLRLKQVKLAIVTCVAEDESRSRSAVTPSVCLSVRPSQNLVIATPLKLLIQLS